MVAVFVAGMRADGHTGGYCEFDRASHARFIASMSAASDVRGTNQTKQGFVFRAALAEVGV
jgi:hypothetical protein